MACLGATGAACAGANGEDAHGMWPETLPALDAEIAGVTPTTFTIEWTPLPAGQEVRIIFRGATEPSEMQLVDGTLGTWTSPPLDLLVDRHFAVVRSEDSATGEVSAWVHLDQIARYIPSLNFGVANNSQYLHLIGL